MLATPMPDRRLLFVCPATNTPSGGIRMIYRQVDMLNRHGFHAFVVHDQPGFRCDWFENSTPILDPGTAAWTPRDIIAAPELASSHLFDGSAGIPKVIFNQNCYYTFFPWSDDAALAQISYRRPDVIAAIVVSQDSEAYLRYAFPRLTIHRLHYSIDPALYHFQREKKRQIALMPRKNGADVTQVVQLLKLRELGGELGGEFELVAIDGLSETAAAGVLRDSLMFLSFGHPEGFGLPPAEAMACGCITVGYHGMGGREFFRPEFSYPIATGDILAFARTVEEVLRQYLADPNPLDQKRAASARWIADQYSPQQEEQDVLTIWSALYRAAK